ncbi:MAG: nucleotide exchange factor GrpE [bacterium]
MKKKQHEKGGPSPAREERDVSGRTATEAETEGGAELDPSAPEDEAASEIERELESLRQEAADATDRALRTLAEFDNYRRRSARELDTALQRGAADVLRELLDVADNFDRALGHAGDDVPAAFLDGMRLVAQGLHDLLDRKGVARMNCEGEPFDPERHDALTSMPAPGAAPNSIVQEIQSGYLMGDRVLRPAKVIVAAAAPPSEDGSGA